MKILTISNYFPSHPGGIEIVAQNLVLRWRKSHEVHWAACDILSGKNEYRSDDIPLKSNNFSEEYLGFPYPIPSLKSVVTIIRQVYWADIVHIHDCLYLANIIAFVASKIISKPIVITQHIGPIHYKENYKNILQDIAYKTIGRLALERADKVIFINEQIKSYFNMKIKIKRSLLIQNGVDHEVFFSLIKTGEKLSQRTNLGLPKNQNLLLFIGRFTQKKGLHIIQEVAKARPGYTWLMLGKGEIDITQWGLKNIIVFPYQPQNKLRDFYVAADLFVLPSRGEGFPLAVQEAMSCGTPAAVSKEIAASLPDAPLISLDTASISETLKMLDGVINDQVRLKEISQQSLKYSQKWDWGIIANLYEDHFNETLNKKNRSAPPPL